MKCLLSSLLGVLATLSVGSANDLHAVLEKSTSTPEFREMEHTARPVYVTARIREAYQNDEVRLVRDALDYEADEELAGEHIFKFFWGELNISRQSRITLISELIAPKKPATQQRAWHLLKLADLKFLQDQERFDVDLSGHQGLVSNIESMPQEYLLYLFKQDGMQAWKLLGGTFDDNPVLEKLAEVLKQHDSSFERGRAWKDEIKPQLRNGEAITTSRDAAYLAWSLSMMYGSGESVRRNNPEISKVIDRMIPGLGDGLMKGIMGGTGDVKQTPAPVAANWIASLRDPAKDKDLEKR